MSAVIPPGIRYFSMLSTLLFSSTMRSAEPETLSDAEKRTIESCIADFDSDDYQTRENAQNRVVALGLKVQPLLEQRLRELRKATGVSAEVTARLQAAIRGVEQAEVSRILDTLDLAVDQAPRLYLPPDPSTQQRLTSQSITFEWKDTPLHDVLALIANQAHVPIVIDPRVEMENTSELPVSLRIADLKTDVTLEWVLKLADLHAVIRGKVVIVTNADRAGKLNLQARTVSLSVAPGDSPWTQEETAALAELMKEWPVRRETGPEDMYVTDPPDFVEATEAGKLLLHSDATRLDNLESFAKAVCAAPRAVSALPLTIVEVDKKLAANVSFEMADMPLCDAIKLLNSKLDGILLLHPKCSSDGTENIRVTLAAKDKPAREAIAAICKLCGVSAAFSDGKLVLSKSTDVNLHPAPCILDARAALQAGIAGNELQAKLNALLEEAHLPANSHLLRGRWLAVADIWTVQRAAKLIEQSAEQKKMAEATPAPWFFATLK